MYQDRQVKNFCLFLLAFLLLFYCGGTFFYQRQMEAVKGIYLAHDRAVASFLLGEGVPKETVARAIGNSQISPEGERFLCVMGYTERTPLKLFPFVGELWQKLIGTGIGLWIALSFFLLCGSFLFFWRRQCLYEQAEEAVKGFAKGDYSRHLPQLREGPLYQMFVSIENLTLMLQARSEAEQKTKEFLKQTISDISHQLKIPLSALMMYQEIMEDEPEHPETIREFSAKMGQALNRMEQLILSMLKIARLDVGSISFEKNRCTVGELIEGAVSELTVRAETESKKLLYEGAFDEELVCDREWTGEAVENLVKNALDHTKEGGTIRISWERSPAMLRILISDDGEGIRPEELCHIFKRFFRSAHASRGPGIGLGLPLAKAIVEGQGGSISVQSVYGEGTTFAITFLTEL